MSLILETEQWKISGHIDWVPKRPDEKVDCWACRGRGQDIVYGDECTACGGNGFKYTNHTTEPRPPLPVGLIEHMRKAFAQYKEEHE